MRNALTVDVEEYFHPTEIEPYARGRWDALPSRIERQTSRVLELLAAANVKATFFVLGWVAARKPALVREIASAGHEIGCHSYSHRLIFNLTPGAFWHDTARALKAIEDACGLRPRLYRAPSYSVTRRSMWALRVLAGMGFTHDSSIYPIHHDRYGIAGFTRHAAPLDTPAGPIVEVPGATVRLSRGRVAPVGGGGYLRLLPYRYTAAGIRRLNADERRPACVYIHPWELDPGLPRLARRPLSRIRTYLGLNGMDRKFRRLLEDFEFGRLTDVF